MPLHSNGGGPLAMWSVLVMWRCVALTRSTAAVPPEALCVRGMGDGFGSQLFSQMTTIAYCQTTRLCCYVQNAIKSIDHQYNAVSSHLKGSRAPLHTAWRSDTSPLTPPSPPSYPGRAAAPREPEAPQRVCGYEDDARVCWPLL